MSQRPTWKQSEIDLEREIAALRAEVERLTKLVNSVDRDNANDAALELLRKALGTRDVHGVLEGIEVLARDRERLTKIIDIAQEAGEAESDDYQRWVRAAIDKEMNRG